MVAVHCSSFTAHAKNINRNYFVELFRWNSYVSPAHCGTGERGSSVLRIMNFKRWLVVMWLKWKMKPTIPDVVKLIYSIWLENVWYHMPSWTEYLRSRIATDTNQTQIGNNFEHLKRQENRNFFSGLLDKITSIAKI